MSRCMICHNKDVQTRYIDLYVLGSEGLQICHVCEMELDTCIVELMRIHMENKKQQIIRDRELHNVTQ